jgi:hypothetical protein
VRLRGALSFAALQLGWFACVLGATRGVSWLGPAVVLLTLAVHVGARSAPLRAREALVLALAALAGFVVDSALLRAGVLTVAGAAVSPPWLVALWPNFAATTAPGGSLAALARRPWLGALVGAIAAPFAYEAGARLGAIGLEASRARALVVIGVAWAPVLPALFALRARMRA